MSVSLLPAGSVFVLTDKPFPIKALYCFLDTKIGRVAKEIFDMLKHPLTEAVILAKSLWGCLSRRLLILQAPPLYDVVSTKLTIDDYIEQEYSHVKSSHGKNCVHTLLTHIKPQGEYIHPVRGNGNCMVYTLAVGFLYYLASKPDRIESIIQSLSNKSAVPNFVTILNMMSKQKITSSKALEPLLKNNALMENFAHDIRCLISANRKILITYYQEKGQDLQTAKASADINPSLNKGEELDMEALIIFGKIFKIQTKGIDLANYDTPQVGKIEGWFRKFFGYHKIGKPSSIMESTSSISQPEILLFRKGAHFVPVILNSYK